MKEGKQRLTAVDLFCGAGGFSLGLIQAGVEVLAGVDHSMWALMTYVSNLGRRDMKWHGREPSELEIRKCWGMKGKTPKVPAKLLGLDQDGEVELTWKRICARKVPWRRTVRAVWCQDIREVFGWDILRALGVDEVDVVVGGPPCQSFSRMGKRRVGDERDWMVFEFARLVHELGPKSFIMEEVPAISTKKLPSGVSVLNVLNRLLKEDYGPPKWESPHHFKWGATPDGYYLGTIQVSKG